MKTTPSGKISDMPKTIRKKGAKKQEASICFLAPDQFLIFCRLTGGTPARLLMDLWRTSHPAPGKGKAGKRRGRTFLIISWLLQAVLSGGGYQGGVQGNVGGWLGVPRMSVIK